MSDAFLPVVVSVAVSLLLYFLNNSSKKRVDIPNDGTANLRMSILYQVIAVAGLLMGSVFLFMPILANEYSTEIFIASGIMFLVSFCISLPIYLWYRNHTVSFDNEKLVSTDAYGKRQRIEWSEISKIKYNAFSGLLKVFDKRGNTVKAHQHLVGFSTLIQVLQTQGKKYHFSCEELPIKLWGVGIKKNLT